MKCKNCEHKIKKRYFTNAGQSMWEWTHTDGGNYCKVKKYDKNYYGEKCFCKNAEPSESTVSTGESK